MEWSAFVNFGYVNQRQVEAWILLLAEAAEMERPCPRSATGIHSVAVDRTPNFPVEYIL